MSINNVNVTKPATTNVKIVERPAFNSGFDVSLFDSAQFDSVQQVTDVARPATNNVITVARPV